MPEAEQLAEENQRLKKELKNLQQQREKEKNEFESKIASEREAGKSHQESAMQRTHELEAMKSKMVKLTRQLDEEVQKRDQVSAESQQLERRLQDLTKGTAGAQPTSPSSGVPSDEQALRERGSQVSTKLMRVVDQWMRQRDLQQALLRGASINDTAFATLVQALNDCPSLQTLDLSQNLLTMDSCSDLCQLITTAPSLSFISLAENLFSLRSVGYFMTAVMERQNTKKLMPLDLLDLQGNEGLVAAAAAPVPEQLLTQVQQAMQRTGKLPPSGVELVAQVMRALWRFLHDTAHPQVKDASPDDVAFFVMDKITLRKMENALMKILLLGADAAVDAGFVQYRPVTANLAFASTLEVAEDPRLTQTQPAERRQSGGQASPAPTAQKPKMSTQEVRTQPTAADPFADLKTAFEPQREKLKTFNLKQIVTRNGTVLMNMLERLLETTEIDARDVETEQTLLEYACHTGNMGLAKLCYRRGANLSAKTQKGETAFNIVTQNKRYDLMEFLHTYGVKVNSADAKGRTALHVAAANDDVDGVCRLMEWGADVNIKDDKKRTPIHVAAASGNMKTTMLLLEVGADMNAKDDREYTAVAHAEANNHFVLMDRLVQLGGRGHGLHQKKENECGLQVVKAMVDGFAKHPEKFIGLTVHSSYSDFQAYFHNTGMHGCPRPCLPQEEKCVKFGPVYPGMKAVLWVRNDGMRNHPQWFPELSSGSSDLEIAKVLYQHGNKETPRVCQDDEEEGHFVPAEQWDAFKRKSANPQPKQAAHLEKPFLNCGSHGIGFSVLDFEGHFPVTKPSSYACRTHCADEKATYFNYYAPTQTCHCPPPTAKMVKEIVEENIGGKVRCASTEYIKKLETSEHAEPAVYEAVAFAVPLLLMMVFMVAAVAAISLSRKRCRQLQTLSESGLVAAETGEAVGEEGHERILMMGTLLHETTSEMDF